MKLFLLLFAFVFLALAEPAYAQGLIEGAVGSAIGGGTELGGAAQAPATQQAVLIYLQKQGYTDIGALAPTQLGGRNALQADAVAPGGVSVTLYLDPLTGKILSAVPR